MNTLPTTLLFVDDISKQYHRVYYNSEKYGIYTPNEYLPTFQFKDNELNTVTVVNLINANTDIVIRDIISDITLYRVQFSGKVNHIYFGDNLANSIDNGTYYIELSDGVKSMYSNLITVCDNLVPDDINTIEQFVTVENSTSSGGKYAKALIVHLVQSNPAYGYFSIGKNIRLEWGVNDETLTFGSGFVLNQLIRTGGGWEYIRNSFNSNVTIKNDFNISLLTDKYGNKGLFFEAKQYGTAYNLNITSGESYSSVNDYINIPSYAGVDASVVITSSSFWQTIELPQPWQWYTSLEKTYFKRYTNSEKRGTVQITDNQFIPFIVRRTHTSYPLTHWYLRNPNTNAIVVDVLTLLTSEPVINYVENELRDYIVYYGQEKFSSNINCGVYYCELTDGINTWYSDLIQVYGENIIPHQTTYGLWTTEGKMAYKTGGYALWRA